MLTVRHLLNQKDRAVRSVDPDDPVLEAAVGLLASQVAQSTTLQQEPKGNSQ